MRHALGFVLGLLLGAGALAAAGWGYFRAVSGAGDPQSTQALTGLGLAAGAGLVIGLLATARWLSPLAALVAGLAYVGLTGFYVLAVNDFADLMPDNDVGNGTQGLVASGMIGLVGVALIISALHPHRWAAAREKEAASSAEPMYSDLPPYDTGAGYSSSPSGYSAQSPGYSSPSSGYSNPSSGYSPPSSGYGSQGSGYSPPSSGYGGAGQDPANGPGRHRNGDPAS